MRKKIVAFLLLFVIGVFSLVACGDKGGDTPGEGGGNTEALLSEGKEFALIYGSGAMTEDQLEDLETAIGEVTGKKPTSFGPSASEFDNEIVVGNTDRAISVAAQKRLNVALKNAIRASEDEDLAEKDLAGYTVYSDGKSIALVWTSDYGAALVLDYFKENFVFDGLVLEEGYSKTVTFSITGYLEERANKMKEEAWAALAAQLPADKSEEIITSLKTLYGLYSADVVDWLANLYDPGVGGFYFSNSARDNEGFLPDIETTYGIFGFMEASGMMEMYNGDWDAAIPDWLSDAVCDWFIELQDAEDGFFYHPQWPKEYIKEKGLQSRITRDRNSANTTLRNFGRTPKYEISAASANADLTTGFGTSVVTAVSKVVAVAEDDDFMKKYSTVEDFRAYVAEMEAELAAKGDAERASYFYSKGNEFQSITSYLIPEVRTELIAFFDKHQNPDTGMWSENLYYNSTNALHKVGAVYNSLGAPLKYTDKMLASTLEILLWTPEVSPAGAGVDIYNALSCFTYIYSNVRRFGEGTEAEREAKVAEYKALVYEHAATITDYSFQQMTRFAYPDGSFGYNPNNKGQGGTAQGAPVSIAGTKEGDVNGTYIASLDIIDHTMGMLDLIDYTVPLFTEQERYRFIDIVEDLGPVLKAGSELVESVVIDFEGAESESDIPVEISMNERDSEVYIREKKDGDHEMVIVATNWYAKPETESKRNANFTIMAGSVAQNASVGIVEFKISFENLLNESSFNVHFQSNGKGIIASYTVKTVKSGAYFYGDVVDPANKACGVKLYASGGSEMTVRMELYKNQGVTKTYIDGVLLLENKVNNADLSFDSALFEFQGGADMTAVFDDIKVEKDNIPYIKETTGTAPTYPVPKLGRPSYDFEDCTVGGNNYPKDMTVAVNNGTADIVRGEDGKALNLVGKGGSLKSNPNFFILNYDVVEGGNAFVFETDITVNSVAEKTKHTSMAKLQFVNANSSDVFQLLLQTITVDGVNRLRIVDNADSNKAKDNAKVLASFVEGDSIKLKIEYLKASKTYKVYVDGTLISTGTTKTAVDLQSFKFAINANSAIDINIDNIGLTRQQID